MFVDRVRIEVEAGKGGDGCVSFRRERFVPRGGPDGGDGGDGGHITIESKAGLNSLAALAHRKHWRSPSGQPGRGQDCHGANGQSMVIPVPPGTLVVDDIHGHVLKDLAHPGDSVCVARGGKGGKGNTRFKSSTNRAPREATKGQTGESRRLTLELKMIADVGLVGKPNAGKSTLLARVSRATPQIADYPFTTKTPNLGLVTVDEEHSFVMADIPGLIEGAHSGVGLGHEFLRHVERTRTLVHLVEPEPVDGSDPLDNYHTIRDELAQYEVDLSQRPELLVVSKSELPSAESVLQQLAESSGREVFAISAVTGQGLDQLVRRLAQQLASPM